MANKIKHPSTPHLPWSQEVAGDDKFIDSLTPFLGREVWVSEKMDGESTTGYYPGTMHARSLDSAHNVTRDWIKSMMVGIGHQFPQGWRFVFENVAYYHSINYTTLPSFAYLLMIWNEHNVRLAYDDICEWAEMLYLVMPPLLYRGVFNEDTLRELVCNMDLTKQEGYVVSVTDPLPFNDFSRLTAKFVRKGHCQPNKEGEAVTHWLKKTYPNTLHDPSVVKPAFMARQR